MRFRFIKWLWGSDLGTLVRFKSWWPSLDNGGCKDDWRQWGIAWPTMLLDYHGGARRETSTPIWNFIWLRNRLGYPEKYPDGPTAM